MTNQELTNLRLLNQNIAGPSRTVHELVSFMGAMQAQDYYSALWTIGIRTGKSEKEVIDAIEKTEIVRTWPQRGTLHYVAAEDAKWMVDLSAPRLITGAKRRQTDLGLDEKTLESSKALFAAALQGNRRLSRPKMMEVLESAGISTQGGRGYHMLWYASQTALIYLGPMEGKQQTFGLLADLPIKPRELAHEAAVAELARRYFQSHGPATLQDFVWWSGLTMTQARAGLEAVKPNLISEKIGTLEYWLPYSAPSKTAPETALLSGFDEYILGYKDRSAQLKVEDFKRVVPGANGIFMYSVVRNGTVVGLWKRTLKKGVVVIALEPFDSFNAEELSAIEIEAQRYSEFLGVKLELSHL